MQDKQILTIKEVCEELGIGRTTWQVMKRRGDIPPMLEIGGQHRVRREALERWLAERESSPAGPSAA